jgi:hypothetical protein
VVTSSGNGHALNLVALTVEQPMYGIALKCVDRLLGNMYGAGHTIVSR